MQENGWLWITWGVRARIAEELGVSRSTICRDFQYLERELQCSSYGQEWAQFYLWWRREHGQSFGTRPGSRWPQMNRKHRDKSLD